MLPPKRPSNSLPILNPDRIGIAIPDGPAACGAGLRRQERRRRRRRPWRVRKRCRALALNAAPLGGERLLQRADGEVRPAVQKAENPLPLRLGPRRAAGRPVGTQMAALTVARDPPGDGRVAHLEMPGGGPARSCAPPAPPQPPGAAGPRRRSRPAAAP